MKRQRWYTLVVVGALLLALFSSPVDASTSLPDETLLGGEEAISRLGPNLGRSAAIYGMSASELDQLFRSDPYLLVDSAGMLLYADPPAEDADHPHESAHDESQHLAWQTSYTDADTFRLNSRPGAQRTILLDFDGHTLVDTAWNKATVPNGYTVLPYDSNGDTSTFTSNELAFIRTVWARVAEDFAPFEVNVTTQDPGFEAIHRTNQSDQVYGTRLVVTNTPASTFCDGCGGVAYVGVFNSTFSHARYQPAWCFSGTGTSAKNVAECASHEIGHNLGLHHDGVTAGPAYYSGHSPWAPIMGVGYSQPVSQWSKGEYHNANNTQDDLAVMTTYGIPLRPDDHGNSLATASPLTGYADGTIHRGDDSDVFHFVAGETGLATFTANPASIGPNLDILLTLYDTSGTILAQANPTVVRVNASTATGLGASIQQELSAEEGYYLRVEGTGHGSPITGYSKYASLGDYSVTVTGVRSGQRFDSFGMFDPTNGRWTLRDRSNGTTVSFYYGNPGDYPVFGDWDCDGIESPGVYRRSTGLVHLTNHPRGGATYRTFTMGRPGDIPLAGDWNGNGCDTISVYRPSTGQVFISNAMPANGQAVVATTSYYFGNPGDKPFSGDFDGDGIDTVGLHRESSGYVYFRNSHSTGNAHSEFYFGIPNDRLFAGEWLPDSGRDSVGVFRPASARVYLRHTNTQGNADETFAFGDPLSIPVPVRFDD